MPAWITWGVLAIVVLGCGALRLRLLDVPLERDEGEYAYAGQLLLAGVPPYAGVYNMKWPGIYAVYAGVLAVFGSTPRGIHAGLLLANAAAIVGTFALARRLFGVAAGWIAAASFALLAIGAAVQGPFANAEHFVLVPALAGLVLLLRATDEGSPRALGASGLLLGLAPLVKQHGVVFLLCGGLVLLASELRLRPLAWRASARRLTVFAVAAAAPLALTAGLLGYAGVWERFWFWTIDYGFAYANRVPLAAAPAGFVARALAIAREAPALWLLAGVGLSAPLWSPGVRARRMFLWVFALLSCAAVLPGFLFRPHYFVLVLPAVALCVAAGARALHDVRPLTGRTARGLRRFAIPAGVGLALVVTGLEQRAMLFEASPREVVRTIYGGNPFAESIAVADFIRARSEPDESIAVLGSEPQICFYAGRRCATGYVYTYALMERQPFALQMQREMIGEIEASRPGFLVFVKVGSSWLRGPDSPDLIFGWIRRYLRDFELVAVADVGADELRTGAELARAPRGSTLEIWQRVP